MCISTGNFAEWQNNKETDSEKHIVRDPFALRMPTFLCWLLFPSEPLEGPGTGHQRLSFKKKEKNIDREVIVPRGNQERAAAMVT